jgi:hypothetical protein
MCVQVPLHNPLLLLLLAHKGQCSPRFHRVEGVGRQHAREDTVFHLSYFCSRQQHTPSFLSRHAHDAVLVPAAATRGRGCSAREHKHSGPRVLPCQLAAACVGGRYPNRMSPGRTTRPQTVTSCRNVSPFRAGGGQLGPGANYASTLLAWMASSHGVHTLAREGAVPRHLAPRQHRQALRRGRGGARSRLCSDILW